MDTGKSNQGKDYVPQPTGFDTYKLFIECVKYLAYNQFDIDYKTHNQWALILFKKAGPTMAVPYMSKIKSLFGIYFIDDKKLKYKFDVEKIESHFPQLFDKSFPIPEDKASRLILEIQQVLANEYSEERLEKNREVYRLENLSKIKADKPIYECDVVTKGEEVPHFREGISFRLKINSGYVECEVVDYELENEHLYFTSQSVFSLYGKAYAIIDTSFIIQSLKEKIIALSQSGIGDTLPVYKFISKQTESLIKLEHPVVPKHIYARLDEAQQNAFNKTIDNDLTFIWGPPGTGKSFTLAAIIRALYGFEDERTVVCCVSNVAVDELAKKVIDIIDAERLNVEPGNFYRSGHSLDEKIIVTDYLFPKDAKTTQIRNSIKEKLDKVEWMKHQDRQLNKEKIIETKAEIKDLRVALRDHTEYLVGKSRVVFSTIANFVVNKQINNSHFDNLIVDEASMLALPQLLALAKNVTKRIILVGDFQQLSPISLVPDKHLRYNVFKIAGIDIEHTSHKALCLLMNQRRSHRKIVDIINKPFYKDKLHAEIDKVDDSVNVGPFSGRTITTIDVPNSSFRFTKGGTRQNVKTAEYIISLLREYYNEESHPFTIGVITPYKGQANMLNAMLAEQKFEQPFLDRIRIGTVHTFQGSECDVIIYDIVDCDSCDNGAVSVGKIYSGEEGEQLLNVALSRPRHKLIVVGNAGYFDKAPGNNLSSKSINVLKKLDCFKIMGT